MSDLISRKATIDKINERQRNLIYRFGFESTDLKMMNIAKSIVTAMPSVQLKRKPGHWIDGGYDTDGMHYIKCSVCGGDVIYGDWDYCPNCGTDMRGDQDETIN